MLMSHDLSVDTVLPGMQDDRKGAEKVLEESLLIYSLAQKHSDGEARLAKVKWRHS